jgi:hypothetical protein
MSPKELLHLIHALEQSGFHATFGFNKGDQKLALTIVKKRGVEAVMK